MKGKKSLCGEFCYCYCQNFVIRFFSKKMDQIKWQLNFMSCNFGLKSYLWFQIELVLRALLILRLRVWLWTGGCNLQVAGQTIIIIIIIIFIIIIIIKIIIIMKTLLKTSQQLLTKLKGLKNIWVIEGVSAKLRNIALKFFSPGSSFFSRINVCKKRLC